MSEEARGRASDPARAEAVVVAPDGRRELHIGGVVQSVEVWNGGVERGYWPDMLPETPPSSALILGLGGGTIVHLLRGRFGRLPIVGVENDPAVVDLAGCYFALADVPDLRIVVDDAFAFLAASRERFDFIAVDLFRAGEVPRGVTATTFLRQVRRSLRGGGLAVFNLARDRRAAGRLHRLSKVFQVEKRVLTGFNLVVHCRAPAKTARAVE